MAVATKSKPTNLGVIALTAGEEASVRPLT